MAPRTVTPWQAVQHLEAAQTALDSPEDRGKWMMIQQVINAITTRNLHENLPIASWAYDPEIGQISPQYHRLKDLRGGTDNE